MNEERAILHSDLNSFYASVEMMLDPFLKGKAVAVCGSTENRHGIVLAKSDLAKKAGVKTGMVNWEAWQLCKDLIMVPPQYDQYLKYSKLTRAIYERYTDQVEPFGIKSVGHGITCTADLENEDEVFRVILELSQDVGHRLRIHGLSTRGVQIYVRGNDLFGSQFQCKLPYKTQLPGEIALAGFRLFHDKYRWAKNVRAVCIRAIDLVPKDAPEQLSIFDDTERREKRERMEDAVEEIRARFGKRAITCASLLGDLKIPCDGRDTVKMPGLMYQ